VSQSVVRKKQLHRSTCQIKVRTFDYHADIASSGKGVVGGERSSSRNCIIRRRIVRRRTRTSTEEFRETLTMLFAKGAGAACAQRDQH
jgi:hypothetical protein